MRHILAILPALALLAACAPTIRTPAQAPVAAARDTTCAPDFDAMESAVRAGYPGLPGMSPARRAEFEALTQVVRGEALRATDPVACMATLQRWTAWFGDNHMQLGESRPAQPASATPGDDRPSLRIVDDSTAVLRLPSFGRDHKASVDSLVAAHRAWLLATPFLVVDVRGNGGGWTAVYDSVLPFLYTNPIRVDGMDIYAAPANLALVREMIASGRGPAAMLEQARAVAARMEANPGGFVTFTEDREIRLDTVYPNPRAVALLVDRRCASSCEQFILDARQSRKVTVVGTGSTRGMLDYGNLRRVPLPSEQRRFFIPTARSRRLPATPLDRTGIAPAVLVPPGTDPLAFAVAHLRTR
ncbi:MAG: hypothetical protein AVDCRST_MAG68-2439 [uncultured Gemmatimonadetes bacterium]|uniref:Tail specific protease domain-containing protein n=1 Tax=uncultured Gemmatimonadota bacterium TaxID=203437 RepID=A0A6J4LJ71_9BACT|nr:MAG: hypothetical protein AVDCRST_MAG68-2439 [uncultured Gemmatimonadota bacterium]